MKKLKELLRGLLVSILYVRETELHPSDAHKLVGRFIAHDTYYQLVKSYFVVTFLFGIIIGIVTSSIMTLIILWLVAR